MSPFQTHAFDAISLSALETKADMLTRLDNKYILTQSLSQSALKKLYAEFDILTIEGKSSFAYHNVYFDAEQLCFNQHQQGKRHKFKARTRHYLDSNLTYFEVKLSGKAGQTDKFRIKCTKDEHGIFTDRFRTFLVEKYRSQYGKEFAHTLTPSVTTSYTRVTLVAKHSGERMTIDYALSMSVAGKDVYIPQGLTIVETKSKNGNGIADKILRAESIPAVRGCSKFCIAMSLSGEVLRFNQFRPLILKYFQS